MEKNNHIALYNANFIREIKQIVTEGRQKAYTAINLAMVEAYWQMGKRIVEEEQQGKGSLLIPYITSANSILLFQRNSLQCGEY